MARLKFYLDENVPVEIARQLRARDIDVVTARELGVLGDADQSHLNRATEMGRVFCTHDSDLIELAEKYRLDEIQHAGIVFAQQDNHQIGTWVKWLELMHGVYDSAEMINHIEYVKQ